MASHSAREVIGVEQVGDSVARVRFVLECGCQLERELPDERLIDTPNGPLLVGKYPCPEGHSVGAGR